MLTNLQIYYFSFSSSDYNLSLDISQYILDTTTAVADGPVGLWSLSQPGVIRDQAELVVDREAGLIYGALYASLVGLGGPVVQYAPGERHIYTHIPAESRIIKLVCTV